MEINDSENQFLEEHITIPDDQTFVVIVGQNNSGKSTFLRSILKTVGIGTAFRIDVNRTALQGEGALDPNYGSNYPSYLNSIASAASDNLQRPVQVLQDFFRLSDAERAPITAWYNDYFPNPLYEERENTHNSASPMLLKANGHSITQQGSGMRATIEIFVKLFDPSIKVLLIDEPELGLEPYLQKFLLKALKDKASADKRIFIATHSHHFVDQEEMGNNYVCERTSDGKISLTQAKNLNDVIFRLLGNSLSSFLLPERILILEGPSDFTFVERALQLAGRKGYAIHGSGGIGNISYATHSISQFLKFNGDRLSVYKDNIFVVVDKPAKDVIVREWKMLLDDEHQKRICVLPENGIEFYYPEPILQQIFNTAGTRTEIVTDYLANNPNSFNDVQLSKTQLAKKTAELLDEKHLDEVGNVLFSFIKQLP